MKTMTLIFFDSLTNSMKGKFQDKIVTFSTLLSMSARHRCNMYLC